MSAAKIKFYDFGGFDEVPVAEAKRFGFTCPKGRGSCHGLLIAGRTEYKRDGQNKNGGVAMWDLVDATPGKETFKPSINCKGCWHGYIIKGRCVDTSKQDEPEPKQ